MNPNGIVSLRNLGLLHLSQKNYEKALPLLRRSLELEPKNDRALLALGDCYWNLGQFVLALDCYQRLGALNPAEPLAYVRTGMCYGMLQKYDEAFQQFGRFIELTGKLDLKPGETSKSSMPW